MNLEARHGEFVAEVRRWNRQISLVSRANSEVQISALVEECREAWTMITAHVHADRHPDRLSWVDLGSGGGFPGIIWSLERELGPGDGVAARAWLYEPRVKRAWFLERCCRRLGLDRTAVVASRWGDSPPVDEADLPGAVVISMKALRLDDDSVLDGLARWRGAGEVETVEIVRFVRSRSAGNGQPVVAAGWRARGEILLRGQTTDLLVSSYDRD